VEFNPSDSLHKADPSLVISKEQATAWMSEAGLVPDDTISLCPDKWFVIFRKK